MGYGDEHFRLHRGRGGPGGEQARWSARSPFRPRDGLRPDAGPAGAGLAARTRTRAGRWSGSRPSPGSRRSPATATRSCCGSTSAWIEETRRRARGGRRDRGCQRRPRRGQALRRLLLGRQHDQGAAHRPPPQPRGRPRDRRRAGAGRRPGRAPQPDLRRRPQHGRGDGRRRPERPRPAGLARRRREERPLRRRLLRRLRHRRPRRRHVGGATPTTAPRTRSPASPRCTTTRPTS